MNRALIVAALAVALLACGERPQNATSARKAHPVQWNAAQDPFVVPGWKSGDKASWEAQLRERTAAQNEYGRVSPRP